ncbi:hypothetical protein LTR84_005510 [Exophiala bonariae]|uniref:CFEM domain-containing protein n=1 Tax=Exophiala bonariae TaxID=1690606 RepID=A0AAV9N3Z3_9EURO|nr:hypothetical protein LTR84_005510 [Exophiala bonariae]
MRFSTLAMIAVAALVATVNADLESVAALYPPCGLDCTITGIAQSNCSATDQACICTNRQLAGIITACVAVNCTIKEQLATKNASMTACGVPIRDRTNLIIGFGAGGGAVAFIFFVIRIYAKFIVPTAHLGYDDLCITIAMTLLVAFSVLSVELAEHGFGTDLWTIPPESITKVLTVRGITPFMFGVSLLTTFQLYFADELLYITIISMTKIAILCFYLRVFPEHRFRVLVFCTMGATLAYMLAFLIVSAFQCWPVSYAWTHWDGEHHGRCNNVNAQGWAAAAINIALDVVILVLPLRLISKLSLHWKKKLQISLMLSVGGFVTIVSILRLETLYQFAKSTNMSWDGTAFGYWSCIEMDVGIICSMHTRSSGKGILSTNSGITAGETPAERRNQDTKDFLPLVDIENVRDNRPGIAL